MGIEKSNTDVPSNSANSREKKKKKSGYHERIEEQQFLKHRCIYGYKLLQNQYSSY